MATTRTRAPVDRRAKFEKVRVLLADRTPRSAQTVVNVLLTFGFRQITQVRTGAEALAALNTQPFDFVITEWDLVPSNGLQLVKAIRTAKREQRLPNDVPILMLTAHSEISNVQIARDVGISEFVVKPFSAKNLSDRIIELIDNPRVFVDAPHYAGPCRRRREGAPAGMQDRRLPPEQQPLETRARILPPNRGTRERIGVPAAEILTPAVVAEAEMELISKGGECLDWAKDDIQNMEQIYEALSTVANDPFLRRAMHQAAGKIRTQSALYGYELGTLVAKMLIDYMESHSVSGTHDLLIIRKHIDTIRVIFTQNIKDGAADTGRQLIDSLIQMTKKFG